MQNPNTPSHSLTKLASASKKIQKSKNRTTTSTACGSPASEANKKKYNTYNDEERTLIIKDLKRGVMVMINYKDAEEEFSDEALLSKIESFNNRNKEDYNQLLTKILTRHVLGFENTTKSLTAWRKKIKEWIKSAKKPETRGGLVVAPEHYEEFRQRILSLLGGMFVRSIPNLQEGVIAILRVFHDRKNTDKDFDDNTCSKHWWFNFCKKNQDIKQKWEDLPLERSLAKLMKQNNSETMIVENPTQEEENVEEKACEAATKYMSSPVTQPFEIELYEDSKYVFGLRQTMSPQREFQIPFEATMEEEELRESVFMSPVLANHNQDHAFNFVLDSPSRFLTSAEQTTEELGFGYFRDEEEFLANVANSMIGGSFEQVHPEYF